MVAIPRPSLAETRANETFDALLWCMSRPGLTRRLPKAGESPIIEALLDRECRVHSAVPGLMSEIMRTGAAISEIEDADHVFLGTLSAPDVLKQVQTGNDLYPDHGATVIARAAFGQGQRLRMSGPGVDGTVEVSISGLPDGFWQTRSALIRYPIGFDVFLIDHEMLIGVPRSTSVEVL